MVGKIEKKRIVEAIRRAECGTGGEIRVHVTRTCRAGALEEAKKVFKKLKMHKTAARNGVLIFVATKDHEFAIIGDREIDAKTGTDFWETTRDAMEIHFKRGDLSAGIEAGVLSAGEQLKIHFPKRAKDKNELTDAVSEGNS